MHFSKMVTGKMNQHEIQPHQVILLHWEQCENSYNLCSDVIQHRMNTQFTNIILHYRDLPDSITFYRDVDICSHITMCNI